MMKQINIIELIEDKENNEYKSGKELYEEEIEKLCCEKVMIILKNNITDKVKFPYMVRALNCIDDVGCNITSNDDDNFLIQTLYMICLEYTYNNVEMLTSTLSDKTKEELILHSFPINDIENTLQRDLLEIENE